MTTKTTRAKRRGKEAKAEKMLADLWPSISPDEIWDRKKNIGFATIPRTLPYIMKIIDHLSEGQASGFTYLTVWSRCWHPGISEMPSEQQASFEAGFSGERRVDTWRKRMKNLKRLGFIDYKPGSSHAYQWVLFRNPYKVIVSLKDRIPSQNMTALSELAFDIGVDDL